MRWRMTGRMISVRQLPLFLAVISFLSTIAVVPAVADKRVALVVGNSTYKNVAPLGNPGSDARLIADALRSLGFTLVGGSAQLDLDKAQFDSAVQSFSNQIQGADVGLFYYAGHGVQVRGSNYLVPVTANPTRESDVDFQLVDTALPRLRRRQAVLGGCQRGLVLEAKIEAGVQAHRARRCFGRDGRQFVDVSADGEHWRR